MITCFQKICRVFWKVWAHKTCKSVISVDWIDGKTDDLEIANAFRDSLSVCSNRKDSIDVDFIQDCDGSFLPWKLNVESVDKVIFNHMKRGKAAGYDNLTLEHIVNSHPSLICHLCKLFNYTPIGCHK